jgi:hypothetical protein
MVGKFCSALDRYNNGIALLQGGKPCKKLFKKSLDVLPGSGIMSISVFMLVFVSFANFRASNQARA